MKKDIEQKKIGIPEISVSRSTSNGMKKRKNYSKIFGIFFLIFICFSSITNVVIADEPVNIILQQDGTTKDTYTLLAPIGGFDTAPDNIGDYFNKIFLIAIGLCGALAVIMIVIGGVQYMGDESVFGKTEAKSRIMSAILGLLIALGSYALLNTINPDLLGKKGVNIAQVSTYITEAPLLQESTGIPAIGVALGTKGSCPEGRGEVIVNNSVIMNTCKSISGKVTQMIILAKSNSINLSGSSFRSYSDQAQARVNNHCPDVYTSPASACKPPTAIPGTSMHESGLAIDFKCDGIIIGSQDNSCFIWLKNNASTFGLQNFTKEPWHWSTNGS